MANRDFAFDDALLMQRSRTLHVLFLRYLSDFSAFDPSLNATYAANWLSQIEICLSHPTDESTVDEQEGYTSSLVAAKKQGFKAAEDLEYYVKKAFPDDKRAQSEFGFSKIAQARGRTLNQIVWLFVMKKVADNYTAELTTVDMSPTVLINLENAAKAIAEKEVEQEYFKRVRLRLTTQRIKKFNGLYAIGKRVESAAAIVFWEMEMKEEKDLFVI